MSPDNARKSEKPTAPREDAKSVVWVSSKADAFIDGIASLLQVYPDPRARSIRAFHRRRLRYRSVDEALRADWLALAHDMQKAIEAYQKAARAINEAHEFEDSSKEGPSAGGLKPLHAR